MSDAVADSRAETVDPHRGPYQLLPPLAPEVLAQLEASIRLRGVEDLVFVDEEGNTLDGHHRRMIAERLGVPYETRVIAGLSEDEKRLYAIRRNTERRQLSRAQRALVGMRAEPSFRAAAKARQGSRTDLSPDQAKSRRVWAAEEAARLVGLRITTYKTYRDLITKVRRERGADTVDSLIELGTWDVAELRAMVTEYAQRDADARRQAEVEAWQAKFEEEARQAWALHGLLGRGAGIHTTSDEWWQCPSCEAYWPPADAVCGRCGRAPSDAGNEAPPVSVDAIGDEPPPVAEPVFSWVETQQQPQEPDDSSALNTEEKNRLWHLQQRQLQWYARTDPRAIAPHVIAEWNPRQIAELRDGIGLLTGWLAALDAALSDARLLQSMPDRDTAKDDGDIRE